jgi:hypothetical protein
MDGRGISLCFFLAVLFSVLVGIFKFLRSSVHRKTASTGESERICTARRKLRRVACRALFKFNLYLHPRSLWRSFPRCPLSLLTTTLSKVLNCVRVQA